jgi:hypothetical protein
VVFNYTECYFETWHKVKIPLADAILHGPI